MNLRFQQLSSKLLIALVLSVPLIQGCTATQEDHFVAAEQDKQFISWLDSLLNQIKNNPKYDRLPINTKNQEKQFYTWLNDAYHKRISKHDFMRNVNSTYPNHEYETAFIVSRLP